MKPFWFAFNVTDWLSSKSVRLMSLLERGAYIGLLATAWGEDVPGTLPADEDEVRRMAEMTPEQWALSGPRLLKKFPLSECQTYRFNPRLLAEGQEQKRKSELAAEAGRRSAEAKKQRKGNGTPTDVAPQATDVEKTATERQLVTTTITELTTVSSDAGGRAGEQAALTSQKGGQKLRDHGDTPLFNPADWPGLNDPQRFAALCTSLDFPQVDFERYRKQILVSLEGKEMPATSLRNWIKSYLNNDKDSGELLVPPVQVPNDIPSNYTGTAPYVAPIGQRIPDMSSLVNPNWKPPQA